MLLASIFEHLNLKKLPTLLWSLKRNGQNINLDGVVQINLDYQINNNVVVAHLNQK